MIDKTMRYDKEGERINLEGDYYIIGKLYYPRKGTKNTKPRKFVKYETNRWGGSPWVFYDADRKMYGEHYTPRVRPITWREWADPKAEEHPSERVGKQEAPVSPPDQAPDPPAEPSKLPDRDEADHWRRRAHEHELALADMEAAKRAAEAGIVRRDKLIEDLHAELAHHRRPWWRKLIG